MKAPIRTVQQASGTYTCPAGRYARVSAYCRNGGLIKVNTVTVLESASWSVIRRHTGNLWSANATGEGTIAGGGNVSNGSLHNNTGGAGLITSPTLQPVYGNSTAESITQSSFMVVAGDAVLITGTGGLHVEEYTY